MIEQGGEYIFTIYDDDIRRLVSFDLSDGECTDIAYELESHFDDFIVRCAEGYRGDRTKVCPECGTKVLKDMDVCYVCLHEFDKE